MKVKILLLVIVSLFVLAFPTTAQVETDLQLTVSSPLDGEVIPYGDTAKLIVTIKNLGPANINGDTIALRIDGWGFATLVRDTIAVGDSVNVHMLSAWNTDEDDSPFEGCLLIDYTIFNNIIDGNSSNDTSCLSFILEGKGSTGLQQYAGNSIECTIYPNPAHSTLHLTLPPDVSSYSYSIIDYTGKLLMIGERRNTSSENIIDVSSLPSGLYYININSDKGRISKKISVVH